MAISGENELPPTTIDEFGCQHQADQRPDRRIFKHARPQLREVDVEHHHHEEEENRDRADINDEQDHRQELGTCQKEQAGGVEERQDQEQHGINRIPRRNHHERRRNRDE